MKNRKRLSLLIALALIFSLLIMPETVSAASPFNQKGAALAKYNTKKYKLVKNTNYGVKKATPFKVYDVGATTPHSLTKLKGNRKISVKTQLYLPKNFQGSGDMGNPQSINITPGGRYAYVTYPKRGSKTVGRIIRYDLEQLRKLGVTKSGSMDDLRSAVQSVYKKYPLDTREKQIYACMKVGPWITFGHGAAMSFNPKDNHLWFTTKTGSKKTDLQRINMNTLRPDYKINYKVSDSVSMGNNLTFDKYGRFYFFCYSGGSKWAPKGTVKIYQGTINLKSKTKKVSIKLVMNGIRNRASTGIQSAGYNPKLHRIYLVSNSALISVPVSKFGKMAKNDVWTTLFKENREFEGISYDKYGNGYLLVNKQPEIMKVVGM